jgi:dipeptidyl aminopeptidase/acylaminoacyl peptidase
VEAYVGPAAGPERSPIGAVAAGATPLLLVMSELDPPEFQRQTLALATALVDRRGAAPLVVLRGHNHFSSALHLNGSDPFLGRQIVEFCTRAAP